MPSPAPPRPGLTAAAVVAMCSTVVVATALAVGPLAAQPLDDPVRPLTTLLAVLGVAATGVGLAGRGPSWAMAAAGFFGAELVSTLFEHARRIEAWTPITAAGLLLLCELVAWAAEARDGAFVMPPAGRRLPKAAVLVLVTVAVWVAVTGLAQLAAAVAVGRDLVVAASGAIAVAILAAALLSSTRRRAAT